MLNFANLFNQFRSSASSSVSDLLEEPNTKMTKLLDEDSFVNEYKSNNSKVLEFMKYEKMAELVEFITIVGPPQDRKRSYKFPLTASELLSLDNSFTIDFFFPEKPLTVEEITTEEVQVEIEIEEEIDDEPSNSKEEIQSQEKIQEKVETVVQGEEKTIIHETLETGLEQVLAEPSNSEQPKQEGNNISTSLIKQKSNNQAKSSQEEEKEKGEGSESEIIKAESSTELRGKRMIKKMVTQTIQRTVKKEVQPLIYKLISYFDGEVNYTLAGYVCKVLTAFFNKKPVEFLKFILQPTVTERLLNHAQSRSVGELIIKILTNQTTNFLAERGQFFREVLQRLSKPCEVHVMSNISSYVCEIIQKISSNLKSNNKILQFSTTFFFIDIVTFILKNIMSEEQNVSIYNAPILFTYLTNVPFVLPEEPLIIESFKQLLDEFINKSLDKLNVTNRERPKLGLGRVKIIEIIRYILANNILNTKEIIAKKQNFFPLLLNLMKNYEMNNVLHNEIMKIIEIAVSDPQDSLLNNSLLNEEFLLDFIIEEANEDKKIKAGASTNKHRKGYIAHLINLCTRLMDQSETNQTIKKYIEKPHFIGVYENFVEKEVYKGKKSLAGFAMRKDLKHQIMFQKEDIIANYMSFFTKCPVAVYEVEEHINIQHPDLVEELQKQLEQTLLVKQNEDERNEEIQTEFEPEIEAEPLIHQQKWTVYLEYDVDHLMNDIQ